MSKDNVWVTGGADRYYTYRWRGENEKRPW